MIKGKEGRLLTAKLGSDAQSRFSLDLRELRSKACRRAIRAASVDDEWTMMRFAAINRYFVSLTVEEFFR